MGSEQERETMRNSRSRVRSRVSRGGTQGVIRNQDYIEARAAEITGEDKGKVKDIFNACWYAICDELEQGNTVKLHGKGKFYLSRRSSRIGRNPATGEEHIVPEREAMAYQTSPAYAKKLRERRLHHMSNTTQAT